MKIRKTFARPAGAGAAAARLLLLAWAWWAFVAGHVRAGSEETLSPVTAVPAGKITIDGDLSDWDFTGSQIAYASSEVFDQERGEFVFAYDQEALFIAARVADATPLRNIYHPTERFWFGDSITLRLYTRLNDN
jgi:hypothetical protein